MNKIFLYTLTTLSLTSCMLCTGMQPDVQNALRQFNNDLVKTRKILPSEKKIQTKEFVRELGYLKNPRTNAFFAIEEIEEQLRKITLSEQESELDVALLSRSLQKADDYLQMFAPLQKKYPLVHPAVLSQASFDENDKGMISAGIKIFDRRKTQITDPRYIEYKEIPEQLRVWAKK